MEPSSERSCVTLPVAEGRRWIVPQNCLAELVTLPSSGDEVPAEIEWRGSTVPVLDFGLGGNAPWCDPKSQSGLVAVFLGLREQPLCYWAVALRGGGVGMQKLDLAEVRELECAEENVFAAFESEGEALQIPDLPALQACCHQMTATATA